MATDKKIICPECKEEMEIARLSRVYQHEKAKKNVKLCFGANYALDEIEHKDLIDIIDQVTGDNPSKKKTKGKKKRINLEDLSPPEREEVEVPSHWIALMVLVGFACAVYMSVIILIWMGGSMAMPQALKRLFLASIPLGVCFFVFFRYYSKVQKISSEHERLLALWRRKFYCRSCGEVFLPE